jgi:hypothetical protein
MERADGKGISIVVKAKLAKKSADRVSKREVIDRIMQIITAFPDIVSELPQEFRSRAHWEKLFSPRNRYADLVVEVLSELPAFTNLAPRNGTRQAWEEVFGDYNPPGQIKTTLTHINSSAGFTPVKRPRIKYWRDAYGKNEVVQRVRPAESHGYIHNPHRGTATFQRFQGDPLVPMISWHDKYGPRKFTSLQQVPENEKFVPRTTLTYCRWPWAWLEPKKGRYNWTLIDNTLKSARERGQTAQIRFQPYTEPLNTLKNTPQAKRYPPGSSVDVPDWYWDTGAAWIEKGPYVKNEPDSNDPLYLKHFGEFVRAFGKRYDGHPDLESIDIAYAGFWGESGGNSTPATARKLAQIYIDYFRKTTLLGMTGTPGFTHALHAGAKKGIHVGWRADSFGDFHKGNSPHVPADLSWNHMLDMYVQSTYASGAMDAWKTAPVTMEPSATVAHWVMDGFDIDRIIEEGYRFHTTVFMPKSVFYPKRIREKLIEFDRKIGYRYVIRHMLLPLEAKPGAKINVDLYLDNVGCAPIYRPYRLALRFKQGRKSYVVPFATDIRQWMPGHNFVREQLRFPPQLERGEVQIAIGIVDEADTPRVWFAIDAALDEGWHPLTSMDCLK